MHRHLRRILIDTAGYLLILLGILLSPLPGPGGIPLILTGLGLLSIENAWARRLKNYLQHHSLKLMTKLFPDRRHIQFSYDFLVLLLVTTMLVWLHTDHTRRVITITLGVLFGCLTILLINRNRGQRLEHFLRRKFLKG